MNISTIKVIHKDGYQIINETDFDPKKHEMFEGEAPSVVDTTSSSNGGVIELGTDSTDQFSDKQLRDAIKVATGEAPAGRTGRASLEKQFNELNAANAE